MNHEDEHDDESTAGIFSALCDPVCLQLLLHVLDVGEWDREAAPPPGTAVAAVPRCLHRLVDVGLLVRTGAAGQAYVYRVAEPGAVRHLMVTVRQIATPQRHA